MLKTKIIAGFFILASAILPFVTFPTVQDQIGIGTYIFVLIAFLSVGVLLLVDTFSKDDVGTSNFATKQGLIGAVLLGLLLVIVILIFQNSTNQISSLWGSELGIRNSFWILFCSISIGLVSIPLLSKYKHIWPKMMLVFTSAISLKSILYFGISNLQPALLSDLTAGIDYRFHASIVIIALIYQLWNLRTNNAMWVGVLMNLSYLVFVVQAPWLIAIVSIGVIGFFVYKYRRQINFNNAQLIAVILLLLTFGANILVNKGSQELVAQNHSLDIGASLSLSLSSLSEGSNKLLFGVGTGNYSTSFNLYRPDAFNYHEDWDTIYQYSNSQINQDLVEHGVVFSLIILSLVGFGIFASINSEPDDVILEPTGLSFDSKYSAIKKKKTPNRAVFQLQVLSTSVLILLSYFVSGWDASLLILFFWSSAYLLTMREEEINLNPIIFRISVVLFPIVLGLLSIFALNAPSPFTQLIRYVEADQYFSQGLDYISDEKAQSAYDSIAKSRGLIPEKAAYRAEFAKLSLVIADLVIERTEGAEASVEPLYAQAVAEIKEVTEHLTPYSVEFWQDRISIYTSLKSKYAGVSEQIANSFTQLVSISPNQPLFRYGLGQIKQELDEIDEAIGLYTDAISLKNDFLDAHLARGNAYILIGNMTAAQSDFVFISERSNPSDQIYQAAADGIKRTAE